MMVDLTESFYRTRVCLHVTPRGLSRRLLPIHLYAGPPWASSSTRALDQFTSLRAVVLRPAHDADGRAPPAVQR